MLQIYSKWCIFHHDPSFGDFLGPNFSSFSVEGYGGRNFGKLLVRAKELHTCKEFL